MIYADFNGSTPICSDVITYLNQRLNEGPYSNPNAIHSLGKKVMFGMEKCRRVLGKALGCQTNQIIFNVSVLHYILSYKTFSFYYK